MVQEKTKGPEKLLRHCLYAQVRADNMYGFNHEERLDRCVQFLVHDIDVPGAAQIHILGHARLDFKPRRYNRTALELALVIFVV